MTKPLCPIMSRVAGQIEGIPGDCECVEDECRWWIPGVDRDKNPIWDCAIVIGIAGYGVGRRGT